MAPIHLVVPKEADKTRLDRFLARALASSSGAPSRTELQRWIDHGHVKVDGAVRKAADRIREGARVEVCPEPPPTTEALPDDQVEFELVFMDEDVLVINKPPGLVVHPARGHEHGTLVNGLLARGVFDLASSDDALARHEVERSRPGIVHRLDKDTSGIMVVARHPRSREHLKVQFSAHTIEREYVAICLGAARDKTFDTLHGRHWTDRLRFSSKVSSGKRAVTSVRVLERFGDLAALVACRLETGRTHQIRVHLSDDRTPILGDMLYGKAPKHEALREAAEAIGRQALHARSLGFVHPTTGEFVRFEAEPPSDFQRALARLREMST